MNPIRRTIAALIAGAAIAAGAPAAAQSVEHRPIEAKHLGAKYQIDPTKGYILISMPARSSGVFVKTPDAADLTEYQADWDKAFAKEVKRYPGRLKSWQRLREAKANAGPKPIEPKAETFGIEGIERRLIVSFGPQYVFDKATEGEDKSFTYLTELEPGTYTYYGPIMALPNGQAFGTCYCMGTVKFEVKAGQITNLGDFLALQWASDADMRVTAAVPLGEPGREPVPAQYPVPAGLAAHNVVEADWRAGGKLNNIYGITVGRHPTVPGVLAYERDRVIDLKAEPAVVEAPAETAPEAAADAATP